jgi:hypothetical protein
VKCAILRATEPGTGRSLYIRHVSHDGDFSLTYDKAKARTFTPETAAARVRTLQCTGLQFAICSASSVGPVALPYVEKYIRKVEATHAQA